MATPQFTNQFVAELASNLTTGATSLVLKSGHGANFPIIAQGQDKYFKVVAVDKNGNREIIKIIQRTNGSDTLIVGSSMSDQPSGDVSGRAQEGTSAIAITYTDDHVVELRLTASILQDMADQLAGLGTMSTQAASAVAITGGSAELDNEASSRKIKCRDHNQGTTPEAANVIVGTGSPPTASTVPLGTIWIKYVA
jgi:hypothetical protein